MFLRALWLSASMLMSDDLPTLLLPMKANSGLSGFGAFEKSGLLMRYSAEVIFIHSKIKSTYFAA